MPAGARWRQSMTWDWDMVVSTVGTFVGSRAASRGNSGEQQKFSRSRAFGGNFAEPRRDSFFACRLFVIGRSWVQLPLSAPSCSNSNTYFSASANLATLGNIFAAIPAIGAFTYHICFPRLPSMNTLPS